MATTKKKTFDAVESSRRWRIETGSTLRSMTPAQRREHLRGVREAFIAKQASEKSQVLVQH